MRSKAVLKEAIRALAKELNLQVTEGGIRDYYGQRVNCDIGLTGVGLQYGIGWTADKDGSVEVMGDADMQARFRDVAHTAKSYINALKAKAKAKQLNPFSATKIRVDGRKAILEVEIP